jgi:hypothetical protein
MKSLKKLGKSSNFALYFFKFRDYIKEQSEKVGEVNLVKEVKASEYSSQINQSGVHRLYPELSGCDPQHRGRGKGNVPEIGPCSPGVQKSRQPRSERRSERGKYDGVDFRQPSCFPHRKDEKEERRLRQAHGGNSYSLRH